MAAIVTGGSLGLLQGSAALLGGGGQLGTAAHGRAAERVYLNAATGNLVIQGQDEILVGRGPDAALFRTYNSRGLLNDDNGDNWRLNFHRRVHGLTGTLNTAGSTITRVDADGAEAVYTYDATLGKYLTSEGSGAHDTLSRSGSTWTWMDGDTGVAETYDAANGGRLTAVTDESGNALAFTYNASGLLASVQTANGEITYLDYAGTNLTQVRTVASGGTTLIRTSYAYDGSNRLIQVITDLTPQNTTDASTYVTSYGYDGSSRRVATMTQSDGTSLAFSYVDLGGGDYRVSQIAQTVDGAQRLTQVAYNTANRTTTVTDPLGRATVLSYDSANRLTGITMPAAGGAPAQQVSYAYDADGNVTTVTDAKGNAVVYGYDGKGNRIHEHDAAGNTVDRVYGAKNELLAETRSGGLTTRYIYDASTRLRFEVSAAGRVTEHRYNGFGQRVASVDYTGAAYDVSGLGPSATLTEAQLTAWLPADRSKSIRVDSAYNFRGQVASVTTYAAVDSAGNGVVAGQAVTQFVYDQAGNLLQTVDARSFATSQVYDGLGRVLSTTDALGRVTLTDYQDPNRKTVVTLVNGLVRTSTYSTAGELISLLESAGGTNLGETKYFYDANGRLRRTEDPTGVRTHALYDEAGRKVGEVDGDGSLTEYRYDANNNLTHTIRYATAVGTAIADNATLASIRPAAHASDRHAWAAYDAANRPVKSVDAAGFVTQIFYDAAGRATDSVRFANAIATSGLGDTPAAGAINPASSPADRLTRSFYDAQGKLLGSLDGEGFLVEYRYDAAGQLVETIAYATATPAALRSSGTLAQLRPAAAAGDIRSYVLYNARGQAAGVVDGEGYLTETVYDTAGNKTQVIRYATRVTYSAGATLASLRPAASAQDQTTAFAYDGLNRVVSQTGADDTVTQFVYDEVGNLAKTVKAANSLAEARTLTAQYDKQGRLTAELSANGAALLTGSQTQAEIDAIWTQHAIKHTYDAAGRRTSSTDALGNKTLFYYDADGRLAYSINALGEVKQSVYDALGQRAQTVQYGTRLSGATLAGLSGGLVNAALTSAVGALAAPLYDSRVTYTHSARGDLTVTVDELGNSTSLSYNAFGELVGSSQQIGGGQTLDHLYAYDRRGLLTDTRWDPNGINTTAVTEYDAFGRAVRTTDARGKQRTATYDKLGQVVSTRDALNALRETTYDAFGRVLTQTDALGKSSHFTYDVANRSVKLTTPEGVEVTTIRNRHGETVSVTDGRGNATTYQYDRNGNATRVDAPAAGFATSSYDRADRLIESLDARGTRTTYSYDAAGRMLTRVVDPGGLALTSRYVYDAKGQKVSVYDANGVETRTQFDNRGQVVQLIIDPAGLNLRTTYAYDGRGKQLSVTEGAHPGPTRVTQYTYDKLGRLLMQRVDPAGLNIVTSYGYDGNDNVVSRTDANGHATRYVYDAENRLVFTIDALGGVSQTQYDANGRAVAATRYAIPISVGALPAQPQVGDVAVLADPRDRVTRSVYDDDGREVYSIDALGAVVQKFYDANGNVIRKVAYAATIPASTPATEADVLDALEPGAADHAVRFLYDAANRPIFSVDASGAVVRTLYDLNGNAVRVRSYANTVALSADPSQAELEALIQPADADRVLRYVYDAANRQVFAIDAENFVKETRYDNLGRITQTVQYPLGISVGTLPTIAEVQAALSPVAGTSYANATTTLYTNPVQAYGYVASATTDATSQASQTAAVSGQTATVSSGLIQPYTFVGSAKSDSATAATQNVSLTVQNTSITQSSNVANYSWYRSGSSIAQTSGLSIIPGYVGYADATPTGVRASVYQNGSLVTQTYTDVGYGSGESWQVWYQYANGWDEYGNPISWAWTYYVASGTRWNAVNNWGGQVNISAGTLTPGAYTVVLEAWDHAQAGQANGGFYDYTDGTWGPAGYTSTINVNVGTYVQPTYVRWATSTQPAGTSTVTLKYRAAGSTGAYSNATVGVNGANHEANLGAIAAGNYEYVIEYRDSYGRLLKSASGNLSSTAAQTTSASATFNYTQLASGAAAGTSIRFFTQASQWAPVDHVTATVKDLAGNVVSTAVTYPEAESGYNGEVNLKVGAALADGSYRIELTLHYKNGSVLNVAPFTYELTAQSQPVLQTYAYTAAARNDAPSTSTVAIGVSNGTEFQGAAIANHSWYRSGSSIYQTGGLSIKPGYASYGDGTPTQVRASVYQGSTLVAQTYTDVGYSTTESWSVANAWDEYGNPYSWYTAYGTRWNNVNNWSGQVNLTSGSLAPGHYRVVIETWDSAQAGAAENAFYDYTDSTWYYATTINDVVIGTIVQPTVLNWAAATQPAGAATVTFGYKAAGSSSAYTSATVTTNGANQQVSLSGLANGNYDYQIEYRNAAGQLLKFSRGSFTSTQGGASSVSGSFTAVDSSAAAGSSIRYFSDAAQWASLERVSATVKDQFGNVVSTALTYPDAEASYYGEVNLKIGAALADAFYTVELTLHNKNGTTSTVAPFQYKVGSSTRLQHTLSWPVSTQPSGTTAIFKYRPQGSSGSFATATIATAGANREVLLDWMPAGTYEYVIEYRDSYNRLIKSAASTFNVAAGGSGSSNVAFNYTAFSVTPGAGSSITGYVPLAEVPTLERVEAVVKDFVSNATVSTATTYPEAHAGYAGEVNLKTGGVLADGRYNVTVTKYKKDGTTSSTTFYYEVGPQPYAHRTTTVSWSDVNQPAGTTVEFAYTLAGQSGETLVAPTFANGTYTVTLTQDNDDGVVTGLASGTYNYTVRYKQNGQVIRQAQGQFVTQAAGGAASTLNFAPSTATATYASTTTGAASPVQTSPYLATARADTASAATQNVALSVENTSTVQSANVANYSWVRSGSSIAQTSGLSITPGSVGYADATPTGVRATVYQNGNLVTQTATDVGFSSGESWQVWYQYANGWDEYGNPISWAWTYYVASGTRWNNVNNWGGQVNLGNLNPGTYTVTLETWDHAQAGQAENAFYDYTDGTWGPSGYTSNITVNVGTVQKAAYVRWAASTQPAGTAAVSFKYRAAGSTGEYTSAAVGANGANHEVNVGAIGAGNFEYVIEYRDSYNRLLKSSSGTFTSTLAQTTSTSATFNYTAYASTAAAGSSMRYFTQPSQWAPVQRVDATVRDKSGNVVGTATTYPEGEPGYNGEVNLKIGAALAEGGYTVELTITNKDGTTTSIAPFLYEVGPAPSAQRSTTVAWSAASQPAGTTVEFAYTPAGQSGETVVAAALAGGNHQVVLGGLADGIYGFKVRYKNGASVVKEAAGQFIAEAGGGGSVTLNFSPSSFEVGQRVNTFAYDRAGRLVQSTDALGFAESYGYDALGNKISFTNKKGSVWTYAYDAAGRLVDEVSPAVTVTSTSGTVENNVALRTHMAYDALGNVISRTEADGRNDKRTTQYEYDALGRQVRTLFPRVAVYDPAADNLVTNSAAAINRTEAQRDLEAKVSYDTLGRAVVNRAADGTYSYKVYDAAGRVRYDIDAEHYVTAYEYDAFGNQTATIRYANRLSFGAHGNETPWTLDQVATGLGANAAGRRIDQAYDHNNRLVETVEPQAYAYDAVNNTGALRARRSVNEFNAFGEVARQRISSGLDGWADTYFYYDERGKRIAQIDAEGYLTELRYDAAGNVVRTVEFAKRAAAGWSASGYAAPPAGDAASGYDRAIAYSYDLADRQISETRLGVHFHAASGATSLVDVVGDVTTTFGYDAVGNRISSTDADGNTTYTYFDALGRTYAVAAPVRQTTDPSRGGASIRPLTTFGLDAFGKATRQTIFANGAASATASGFTAGAASAADQTSTNLYDAHGNLIQTTDAEGKSKYLSYDAAGRVAKSWQPVTESWPGSGNLVQNRVEVFQYDALGNQVATIDSSTRWNYVDPVYSAMGNYGISVGTGIAQGAAYWQTPNYDEYGNIVSWNDNWQPTNSVNVNWGLNLAALGGGEVYVQIGYNYTTGGSTERGFWLGGGTTTGATLSWNDGHWTSPYGISAVNRVHVYKKNAAGNLVLIHDTNVHGWSSNLIGWQPSSAGSVSIATRANAGAAWSTPSMQNFGAMVIADLRGQGGLEFEARHASSEATYTYQRGVVANGAIGANAFATEQRAAYNAFGEIESKSVNARQVQSAEYDQAGHLWRTNQGGVDTVYLYDINGKATAEIRSVRDELDLRTYADAASADTATRAAGVAVRTETQYDKLERVTLRELPAYGGLHPSVARAPSVSAASASGSISNQGSWVGDESGTYWSGTGYIFASWSSLAGWGGGDIRAQADVTTTTYGATTIGPQSFGAGAVTGGNLGIGDEITGLSRVRVWKQTVDGTYVLVRDSATNNARRLTFPSPTVQAGDYAVFRYKPTSSSTWLEITPPNFGALSMVDTNGWTDGNYNYEIQYRHSDHTVYASGTGTFNLTGASATVTPGAGQAETYTPVVAQTLDRWGNTLTAVDPRFGTDLTPTLPEWETRYRYDEQNRLLSEIKPQVSVQDENAGVRTMRPETRNFYDRLGQAIGMQDANAVDADTDNDGIYEYATTARYNAAGQVTRQISADGTSVVDRQYDVFGRQVGEWDARNYFTAKSYDRNDRLTQVTRPDGTFEQYQYDELGNRTAERDGRGYWKTYAYNAQGQMIRSTLPNGQHTWIYYDQVGQRTRETNANGESQSWQYDKFGRNTSYVDLSGAATSISYNRLGLVAASSNWRSNTTNTYDVNGALKSVVNNALSPDGVNWWQQSTVYESDAAGNRIRETFTKNGVLYSDAVVTFDATNRVVDVNDIRYHLTYSYDANGNRRRALASFFNSAGSPTTKDYWYKYDRENRIVLSQGTWNGSAIVAGGQGTALSYDAAGNRVSATGASTGGATEAYYYDANGRLYQTNRNGAAANWRAYDGAGNVTQSNTYNSSGTLTGYQTNSYDANGWLVQQNNYKRMYHTDAGGNSYVLDGINSQVNYTGRTGTGQVASYNVVVWNPHIVDQGFSDESGYHPNTWVNNPHQYTNYYSYGYARYGASYKEQVVNGSSTYFQAGSTTTRYDGNGNVFDVNDQFNGSAYRSFITDQSGRILQKTQSGQNEYYFYANEKPLGATGANGTADFDFNYTPVSDDYPATTPSSHVVSAGDTLRSIAQAVFGDGALWYLIADANGITSDSQLRVGMQLTIPNKISNLHNTYQTFKPYAPGEIIGDTTPKLPDPPPPPPPAGKKGKCGGIGLILVIIVAVVVTVITAGAALAALAPMAASAAAVGTTTALGATMAAGAAALSGSVIAGAGMAAMAAAAVGAAVGSIASQLVGMAVGVQEKFSWSAVATSALTAGFASGAGVAVGATAGSGGVAGAMGVTNGVAQGAVNAAVNNVIGQGVNIMLGQQDSFSWRSVATSAVAGGVAAGVNGLAAKGASNLGASPEMAKFMGGVAGGMASGVVRATMRGGTLDVASIAADAFGNAFAGSITDAMEDHPGENRLATSMEGGWAPAGNANAGAGASGNQPFSDLPDINVPETAWTATPAAAAEGPDNWDLMGKMPDTYTAGNGARRGYWGIASDILGSGATNQQILEYSQNLMEVNPGLATNRIQIGDRVYLPDGNTAVSDTTLLQWNQDDAQYRTHLAEQAARAEAARVASISSMSSAYVQVADSGMIMTDAAPALAGAPTAQNRPIESYGLMDVDGFTGNGPSEPASVTGDKLLGGLSGSAKSLGKFVYGTVQFAADTLNVGLNTLGGDLPRQYLPAMFQGSVDRYNALGNALLSPVQTGTAIVDGISAKFAEQRAAEAAGNDYRAAEITGEMFTDTLLLLAPALAQAKLGRVGQVGRAGEIETAVGAGSRLDYSARFADDLANFNPGHSHFSGRLFG